MPPTSSNAAVLGPLDRLQERRAPIKADLKNLQNHKEAQWIEDGLSVAVACDLARLSRKEVAARLGVGENQLGAWVAGKERPQTERFEGDPVLAAPMAVAKAMRRPDVFEVTWTITAAVKR